MGTIMNNTKKQIADMLNISEYMNDMYMELITNINDKLKLEVDIEEDIQNDLRYFWSKICELQTELNDLRTNDNNDNNNNNYIVN
tara:strand:- start:347 stop:601 length:255 start_codon:yes stop_codon:yes gene_type:complete